MRCADVTRLFQDGSLGRFGLNRKSRYPESTTWQTRR
jgi:hypothetical protein